MNPFETLFDLLEQVAATKAKTEKLALIKQVPEEALTALRVALDPTVSFYIAKLDVPVGNPGGRTLEEQDFELLYQLTKREITGNEALAAVQRAFSELTPKCAVLLQRIILKDLRAGIGASTVNAAFPGLVPEFAYMRCSLPKDARLAEWPWEDGVMSQIKADGMFARIAVHSDGCVLITSRQGNAFPDNAMVELVEQAREVFGPHCEVHGELTVWRDGQCLPRAEGNGILNSLQAGGELPAGCVVHYDAWDMIPLACAVPGGRCEIPYRDRFETLEMLLGRYPESTTQVVHLIEGEVVTSYAQAADHFRKVLARGLEGTVVKHPAMPWFDGDSKLQVKFKLEFEVDLRIKGFREGTAGKRTEATFGAVLCETSCGQLEVGVSGFKRDLEQFLHENRDSVIGQVMTVRANDIVLPSESSTLFALSHPRVVELRRDKTEADSLDRVKAQLEAARYGRAVAA